MSASELRTRPGAATTLPRDGERPETSPSLLDRSDRERLLRFMLLMRRSEERALSLYKQGKVPGSFYDGCGQEAIGVGAAYALAPEDRLCILHRDLGAHFVRGLEPERYLANYMGRAGGVTGGRDGNMHFGDRELGCVGMVRCCRTGVVACGMALAMSSRRASGGPEFSARARPPTASGTRR